MNLIEGLDNLSFIQLFDILSFCINFVLLEPPITYDASPLANIATWVEGSDIILYNVLFEETILESK